MNTYQLIDPGINKQNIHSKLNFNNKLTMDADEKLVRDNAMYSFSNNAFYIEQLHLYSASCMHFHFTFFVMKNDNRVSYDFGLIFLNLNKFFIFNTNKLDEIKTLLQQKANFLDDDEFLNNLKIKYQYEPTI